MDMKLKGLLKISSLLLFFSVCLFSSCRDMIFDRADGWCPDDDVVLTLAPGSFASKTMLRSTSTEEWQTVSAFMAVYNADTKQRLTYKEKKPGSYLLIKDDNAPGRKPWSETIGAVKNPRIIVYAIANYSQDVGYDGVPTLADLQNADNLDKLNTLLSKPITAKSWFRNGGYMLMQTMESYDLSKVGSDPRLTEQNGQIHVKVVMKRVESKIDFNIKMADGSSGAFYPRAWRICNVRKKIKLSEKPNQYNSLTDDTDFWSTMVPGAGWHSFEYTNGDPSDFAKNSFSVILPENRLAPQRIITPELYETITGNKVSSLTPSQEIKIRANRSKIINYKVPDPPMDVTNGDFDVAPVKCSYIEVMGDYENDKNNPTRIASVKYTIPLGYADDYTDETGKLVKKKDNYCVDPNAHYTINVIVKSVNDIVAEVKKNNDSLNDYEEDTGQEGHVTDLTKSGALLDCHYGTFILTVHRKDLFKLDADGHWVNQEKASYNVYTPFDGPKFPVPSGSNFQPGQRDIKWVKFVMIKRTINDAYPYLLPGGRESVEDAIRPSQTMEEQANGPRSNRFTTGYTSDALLKNSGYFYVNDLVNLLNAIPYDSKLWKRGTDADGNLTAADDPVIMFGGLVYEYYYDKDFRTDLDGKNLTDKFNQDEATWDAQAWTLFVNQPDREMNLFFKDGDYKRSADHQSTHLIPSYSIRQRSIKTINTSVGYFNPYAESNFHNYPYVIEGFETIDEKYANPQNAHATIAGTWLMQHSSGVTSSAGMNRSPYANVDNTWDRQYKNLTFGYRPSLYDWDLVRNGDDIEPTSGWKAWTANREVYKDHYRPVIWGAPVTGSRAERSSVEFSCLTRNMDLNGDGQIELNEMRWFTPSLLEFLRMKLVDSFLPYDQRLISPMSIGSQDLRYYLVTTAIGRGGDGDQEYMVVNGGNGCDFYPISASPWANGDKWGASVRCVRVLGAVPKTVSQYERTNESIDPIVLSPLTAAIPWMFYYNYWYPGGYVDNGTSTWPMVDWRTKNPNYKTWEKGNVGLYMDLRNLNKDFLRAEYIPSGELPNGGSGYPKSYSIYDKPYYKGFRIATSTLYAGSEDGASTVRQTLDEWYNHTTDKNCDKYKEKWVVYGHTYEVTGWRMPSQTELMYMITYIPWPKQSNTGEWDLRGWSYSDWHEVLVRKNYFTDTMAASEDGAGNCFVLHDDGYDGFIRMLAYPISGTKAAVRCVKDWDPDKPLKSDDGYTMSKADMEFYLDKKPFQPY